MNQRQNGQDSTQGRRGVELLLFLAASAAGIYGLGQGIGGLFEAGRGVSLAWLAVTAVAFFVLFAQMGRVHDTWPRRPRDETQKTTITKAAPNPSADQ